ncbi:MAG: hypothetical protein AAGF47_05820 [Planctomycetota bacterium]
MSVLPFVVIAAIIGLVAFGVVRSRKLARDRREALAGLAGELGMGFDPARDTSHDDRYANFEVFRRGQSRAAFNTIAGETEIAGGRHAVVMGDFIYRVSRESGKSRRTTTHIFSYAIIQSPYPGVTDLLIRPESVFDKIGAAIGFEDIDFESAEFSKKFLVKSPDKRFAYDVITPNMMEMLLAEGKPPIIDLERGMLLLTDGRRRWQPEQFREHLAFADTFFGLWPDHVVLGLFERSR